MQVDASLADSVLNKEQKAQLRSLLYEHQDCFAPDPKNPGTTDLLTHRIDTCQAAPIKSAPARVSPPNQAIIKKSIDEMVQAGIAEPSSSPWASRIVIVTKKDGTPRFCVDYRSLNAVTVKDSYPIPHQTDLLDAIGEAKFFSTLDLASGYWQIKLDEDAKMKSAFVSRYGLYQFTVMPFGLTNAPATFQRMMDVVLSGLTWLQCMVYLDDIIVFAPTWEEHQMRLRNVLTRLRKYKLAAKMTKCRFGRQSIVFLGHVISAEGVSTDPEKVKAIQRLPYPKQDVTAVRSFLGMVGYYRRFIPHYAALVEPLNELLRKGSKKEWTDECVQVVDEVKQLLTTSPILRRPNFSKPFQITCDASQIGVGAVLEQLDEKNEPHPVAYWSKTLNPAQRKYTVTERECLAVVYAFKYFRHYFGTTVVTVYTDHSALQYLQTAKSLTGRLERWALSLQEYPLEIRYRKGCEQGAADGLSRLGHDEVLYWGTHPNSGAPSALKAAAVRAELPPLLSQRCFPIRNPTIAQYMLMNRMIRNRDRIQTYHSMNELRIVNNLPTTNNTIFG